MAQRLITSVRKADRILKSGLIFIGNFNISAQVQQKPLELRQLISQMNARSSLNPTKEFCKPLGPKLGKKSAAFTAGGIGAYPKSSSLPGGRDDPKQDEEKTSSGGRRSGWKNKRQIVFAIGAAGILGVPLQEITDDGDNKKQSVPADLAQLVIAANSTDPLIQYDAVTTLRKSLSSYPNPVADTLISCNILPTLVNCLSSQNPALQFEAAWSLTNIAAGKSEHTQAIVQAGAVPHFLKLLTSPHQMLREVAVVALGNIIGDGPKLRDYVINLGVVAPFLNLIQSDIPLITLRHVAHVIANICRYKDPLPRETLQEILTALNVLIRHDDTEVLVTSVWALWQLTDIGNEHIQMVIDSGVLPKLVQLLNHPEVEVQMAAIRAVSRIAAGTHAQTQAVLNCDVLSHVNNLIKHPNENICMGAMLILSMVTFGNRAGVQAVIDAGFIPLIIAHLEKGEVQTKTAAAFAVISMAMSGNKEQVAHLINCGVIPPFCNLLNDKDSEVIEGLLHGIRKFLMHFVNQREEDRACTGIEDRGGLGRIATQRNHGNKEIGMISNDMIENRVSEDVEEDSNIASEVAGKARQSNSILLT